MELYQLVSNEEQEDRINNFFNPLFNYISQVDPIKITGLMLIKPPVAVVFLEGSTDGIYHILIEINKKLKNNADKDKIFKEVNLTSFTEEVSFSLESYSRLPE
jgi:predicted N-formylglutamate amidohydrolase